MDEYDEAAATILRRGQPARHHFRSDYNFARIDLEPSDGFVDITAHPSVTKNWGSKYSSIVAQLPFDLQVIIPQNIEDTVWTPVIGTIQVLGDVTPGGTI
jgi:hypothetical protein